MFFVIFQARRPRHNASTAVFLLGLVGVLLLVFRKRRAGIALCVTSILLTFVFGITPLPMCRWQSSRTAFRSLS